jgi:hypothetical protein
MSRNPYLDQFLQFYSQADAGNGLTRGLETDLAKKTYVPTKLDKELTPAILEGQYRLVILTGNAGDGKTALIQTVEREAEKQGATFARLEGLGSEFSLHGRQFRTLYDGSVDMEGRSNFEMLTDFFASLAGDQEPGPGPGLIVAMNEGKLRDFLGKSTAHPWLSRHLLNHLLLDDPLPDGYVVVNLNLRSVVDASYDLGDCLLDRILDRYVANEFWEPCEACPAKQRCPVKFNVDSFRIFPTDRLDNEKDRKATEERNSAARAARIRLKALFQVLHFRKRLHVTVRDLRSALAFALFGKKTCAQIEQEIQQGETAFIERYYYNALFSEVERDRVIGFFCEFDAGKTATPQIDSRISFTPPETGEFRRLFLDFTNSRLATHGRTRNDENDLRRLFESRPRSPEERTKPALQLARQYVLSVRRKLFFEGNRRGYLGKEGIAEEKSLWAELLPYDNLEEFIAFVATGQDDGGWLKKQLVEGISRSEGIHDGQRSKENVCIRTRQDQGARVKAFFTYPATDFSIELPPPGPQAHYIEYLPASITLRHTATAVALEVSLDLYEMLMRIRDGYVPTAGEMRAFFLNLLMFKKQLMALPARELLLTQTDYQIYKLTRTPQNGVVLSNL